MGFPSDLDIASGATLKPLSDIAGEAGIPLECLEPYGSGAAKIDLDAIDKMADRPTAIGSTDRVHHDDLVISHREADRITFVSAEGERRVVELTTGDLNRFGVELGLLDLASDTSSDYQRGFGFTDFGQAVFQDTDDDGLPDTRLPDFDSIAQGLTGGIISGKDFAVPVLISALSTAAATALANMAAGARSRKARSLIDDCCRARDTTALAKNRGRAERAIIAADTRKGSQPSVPVSASTMGPRVKPAARAELYRPTTRPRVLSTAISLIQASPAIHKKALAQPSRKRMGNQA